MTSTRWALALALAATVGCSNRTNVIYEDALVVADVGTDATADAARPIDATVPSDAGHDAHVVLPGDAGRDAFVAPVGDSGCMAPVCADLPTSCHYDTSLGPCRCGMVICNVPDCAGGCVHGSYCAYAEATCGASGGGTCTTVPDLCLDDVDPVCGCDGQTYSNPCQAAAAGQNIVYHDACATPTDCRTTGCPSGSTCMSCRGAGNVCLSDGTVC